MKWKDRKILARFRCRNETKARGYWKEEGEKRFRLCKRKEEDLGHVIEECEITGGPKDTEKILNETGEGLTELKTIMEKRRAIQDEEERQYGSTARRQKPKSCHSFRDKIIKGVQYNRVDKRGGRYMRSEVFAYIFLSDIPWDIDHYSDPSLCGSLLLSLLVVFRSVLMVKSDGYVVYAFFVVPESSVALLCEARIIVSPANVAAYLPVLITRSFRYGKYSINYQSIIKNAEVPKRWFKHFYVLAAPLSSYVLYLIICKFLWTGNSSKNVIWILDICLGSFRQALVSPESTFIATLVLTLHCWKRFYETHFVSIFSDNMMNISHYLLGYIHYIGSLVCIIGESDGFVEGSEGNFSWRRITYLQLICAIICVLSSYVQLRTNFILSNLRYNKDRKITSTAYKIPHGGLFDYISGSLQFTEIIIYILLSIILWQSTNFHYITLWVIINQTVTAVLTHKWYIQTFKNYPMSRKILLPYIF
uniref:polyprenol reductase n=1 Tax=Bombus vancouverensis nearcticus TaxID=2705178 RepID=UPI00143BEB2B|nr:polyprenol reductase [Bombus vancouverensis nearcticus]